ncbi:MAG: ExbD/TolR family protein [Alphaproteobacteria bacterium]
MRFQRSKPQYGDDERILPLINVVFLLLIFFMLAGRIAASDPFKVDPALSASEGPVTAQDILVLVGTDGRLALDDSIMDETALKVAVAERMSKEKNGGPSPHVRLKADGRAPATRVVAVMELLRSAGVQKVDLLTVPVRQ